MLKCLHIENIAVIEKADIDFSGGFNVLTGETGAGKSIIIDSLGAVLGQRTSKELIRRGCESAEVSALFSNISKEQISEFENLGYHPDENGELLIMRTLSLNGGSVRINGRPATVSVLKELCSSLVNIHGQHDNQGLLNPDNHCSYIDALADNKVIKGEYYEEFKKLNSIRKKLNAEITDEEEKQRRTELLNYQIKEITDADIKPGEVSILKEKLETARNIEKIKKSLFTAAAAIYGTDETDGALSLLEISQKEISAAGEKYDKILQKISELCVLTEEVGDMTDKAASDLEEADTDVSSLSDRLELIRKIISKYGGSEESALKYLDSAQSELERIELSDKYIDELSKDLDLSTERLIAAGEKLTLSRKKAAKKFEISVAEKLAYLDMKNVKFSVVIESGKYTKNGCDNVEFMIMTNIGEERKQLSKIASGGELSRIMLAIKSILADKDNVDTLIFDEVDTGISGRAAGKVGKMLAMLSRSRQVICVTHLAQICALANEHFKISKAVRNSRTYTEITPLNREGRIKEIARIMSGDKLTENLYNSAEELLNGGLKNADI